MSDNGINTGSDNGTNKELRIRLTLKDIQVINEALHIYDKIPDKLRKYSWRDLHVLLRRFANLAEDDGYYSRRGR